EDVPPGASIVVLAIGVFAVITALAAPLARRRARRAAAVAEERCTLPLPGARTAVPGAGSAGTGEADDVLV
ncbi:metal ABC transporter permease, partial [Streptomyces sp. MCAF7]